MCNIFEIFEDSDFRKFEVDELMGGGCIGVCFRYLGDVVKRGEGLSEFDRVFFLLVVKWVVEMVSFFFVIEGVWMMLLRFDECGSSESFMLELFMIIEGLRICWILVL